MKKIVSLFILLSTLLSLSAQADDTQTLIDKIIATYGGEALWRTTVGIQQEGSTYSQRRHNSGTASRSYQYPGKMKIYTQYENDTELRQLDGDQAWNHGAAGADDYVQESKLQARRLALPLLLLDHRHKIKNLGQRDDDNGHVYEGLELELEDGLKILMEVHLESSRITASWGMMTLAGKPLEFASLYEDFRMVEGRLISFKETHFAMSDNIGYTLLENVTFVSDFPAKTFRPVE